MQQPRSVFSREQLQESEVTAVASLPPGRSKYKNSPTTTQSTLGLIYMYLCISNILNNIILFRIYDSV